MDIERGNKPRRKGVKGIVYGGINDVEYQVQEQEYYVTAEGVHKRRIIWTCPAYRKWLNMMVRCYCESFLQRQPTYQGCSVDKEWLKFSNFASWCKSQPNPDWVNSHLDKDLLIRGNKIYSPSTVVLVTKQVNQFAVDSIKCRGQYLVGASWSKQRNKYLAQCNNPFRATQENLGGFDTELEAHLAWKAKKHEHANQLADLQNDPRVAQALRLRYAPDTDWTQQ